MGRDDQLAPPTRRDTSNEVENFSLKDEVEMRIRLISVHLPGLERSLS